MKAMRSSLSGVCRLAMLLTALAVAGCAGDEVTGPNQGVATVELQGPASGDRVYIGRQLTLRAATFDRDHQPLTGTTVSWSISDNRKADLVCSTSTCQLIAKAAGPAVVTATSGKASSSVSLTIAEIPVALVVMQPGTGAVYVGAGTQFTATLFDSAGTVLSGRAVTWKSSDAARAVVDSKGLVQGLGAGPVVITASGGETSATAEVQVLAAPVADWSGATQDWTTFQGNARHDGYVPVVVDPRVMHRAWLWAGAQTTPLNPVTTGDGRVYVSGGAKLWVLNLSNGSDAWAHEFGPVNSVGPAAYANGTVYLQTGGHGDSYVWAFNAADGAQRFRTPYANQWSKYKAPTIVGNRLFMGGGLYGGMYSFDAESGSERWFDVLDQVEGFTPSVVDSTVYAYTGVYRPRLTAADAATGEVRYEIPDPHFSYSLYVVDGPPVAGTLNDMIITQNSRLLAFDLRDRRVAWEITSGFRGGVTVANGVIYVINHDHFEARRESDGALLWSWTPPQGEPVGTIIATKNVLFLGTTSSTYAIDIAARAMVWSTPTPGALAMSKTGQLLISGSGLMTSWAVR
ncbi:MAG TPA: PQQ-binding-like beta-propeller repeat protein [Longimicrobiaceae bacterium]|nr:PQQ-binding-like beta-propeller repeat protein [Longimicrobiaceae bacterium]